MNAAPPVADPRLPLLGRDIGPVGRVTRMLGGGWLVLAGVRMLTDGPRLGPGDAITGVDTVLAFTVLYIGLVHGLGDRVLTRLNPWTATSLLLTPILALSVATAFVDLPRALIAGAYGYVGGSLLLISIAGYGGCEIIGIPEVLLRRRYPVYCPLNAVDAVERPFRRNVHRTADRIAGVLALLAGIYYFLLQSVLAMLDVHPPIDSRWGVVLLARPSSCLPDAPGSASAKRAGPGPVTRRAAMASEHWHCWRQSADYSSSARSSSPSRCSSSRSTGAVSSQAFASCALPLRRTARVELCNRTVTGGRTSAHDAPVPDTDGRSGFRTSGTEEAMARIPLISTDDATGELAETFAEIEAKAGKVGNVWRALANNPRMLKAVWDRRQSVMEGAALPLATKEAIALAVSEANSCKYCVTNHSAALSRLGESTDRIEEIRRQQGRDDAEQLLLDFAVRVSTNPHAVTDAQLDELRSAGHSDAAIFEAAGVATHYTALNRFLDTFDVDLD